MADQVGQQFGQYRLSRFLGQGSFGEVYLGEHISNHTLAAVKLLQARLTAEDLKEFINEASTMFRLQHPHIVRLLDFGISPANTPFLVMAYASGGTMRQRYPKGTRLPMPRIVTYVSPIASALQHAHDQRLIHRDVKPENILLGPNNEVWLSDFGITSVAHSTRSLDTEKPGGTVPYMAPEQLRGKARPASDQYALGVIVYEWLCGERPFSGTATEIAMQHFLEPPPSLREKMPTISPDVEQVVMTALAKDPAARFASMQAFATALEAAASLSPLDARSARADSVSDTGTTSPATASPEGGASSPNQTKGQSVPATPPPTVVGSLETSAQTPLSEKLASPTASYAETSATFPASPETKRPSAIIFPPDGRTVPLSPLPVIQRKQPLPSTSITPSPPSARMRFPARRTMLLILLVLIVICGSGIWATLHVLMYNPPTSTNIFQMTAVVGHKDSVNSPSIFFAFDLQGQATILELPGGGFAYSRSYSGPLLSGSNVSVTLRFQNVIGNSLPDMIVYAGQDIVVFENNGNSFSPNPSNEVQQNKLPGPTSSNANYPLSWASAVVGHNDSAAHPSDFLAANIREQIAVYEFPGGSSSGAEVYVVPNLSGSGENQSVPTLLFSDRNHDSKLDMIINVAGHQYVFYNYGTKFAPSPPSSLQGTATSDVHLTPTPSGTRGFGYVAFTNQGSVSLDIPTGTLVATRSGIQFETSAEAVLTPGSSIAVPVQASKPGVTGNVPANSIMVILQQGLQLIAQANNLPLDNLHLSVTNDSPITGGGR